MPAGIPTRTGGQTNVKRSRSTLSPYPRAELLSRISVPCEFPPFPSAPPHPEAALGRCRGGGERQRGHVYYRCHTRGCVTVREEAVEQAMLQAIRPLVFSGRETALIMAGVERLATDWDARRADEKQLIGLRTAKLNDRLQRLTDAFIDGLIDKEVFEQRKGSLLAERKELADAESDVASSGDAAAVGIRKILERAASAYSLYKSADQGEKRDLLEIVTSNIAVTAEKVAITLAEPFRTIANRPPLTSGALGGSRTPKSSFEGSRFIH